MLLLESHAEPERERALLFRAPERVLACREPGQVPVCLRQADEAVRGGRHVAGFLAYEAGHAFQPKLARLPHGSTTEHVAWLGVFEQPTELCGREVSAWLAARGADEPARVSAPLFDRERAQYRGEFERIQAYLRAGESYQVCHSLRARCELRGSPLGLLQRLRRQQRTAFSAFVDTGEYTLLSLSPELFFRKSGGQVRLQPMKGTSAASASESENAARAEAMRQDPKTRAENVMIVDLLRNDIGRLAVPGSVRVPELFGVERFDAVLQMTSTITAEVAPELGLSELMPALFPSGSVTGAPKLRTMQIIAELEQRPRGIFCGSIGYVAPAGDACFNVAIRSLCVDAHGQATLGVGSGVVVDSDSDAEYDECLLKARFLSAAAG